MTRPMHAHVLAPATAPAKPSAKSTKVKVAKVSTRKK